MKNFFFSFRKSASLIIFLFGAFFIFTPFSSAATSATCCKCASKENPETAICIKFNTVGQDCAALPGKSTNTHVKKLNCTESLSDSTTCKTKTDGGVCIIGPITESTYTSAISADSGAKSLEKPVIPELNVKIPGLTFSDQLRQVGSVISVPFLAQYISAIYIYLVGLAAVAAAIMIVYGGFLYIVGSSGVQVQQGKTVIVDAVIGLLLILGIYTILAVINPDLLKLNALNLPVVKSLYFVPDTTYQQTQAIAHASGYKPDPDIVSALKTSTGGTRPAPAAAPSNIPLDDRMSIPRDEIFKILEGVAQKLNIDPCIPKAILATESGFENTAIGHDEDSPHLVVQARLDFLRSGKKYSGATFEPPKDLPDNCTKDLAATCQQVITRTTNIRNDDTFKPAPPYFGLDWRFPHGIGSAQCTIYPPNTKAPHCYGPNGEHGRPIGDTCYTVPILMTWEGQMECMMKLLKAAGAKTPCGFFKAFGGLTKQDPNCTGTLLSRKMKAFVNCKAGKL
jgi:hypothetical protein